jgi:hypothetical protein
MFLAFHALLQLCAYQRASSSVSVVKVCHCLLCRLTSLPRIYQFTTSLTSFHVFYSIQSKSHDAYPGYEKVDLFDALNAFNIIKRRESMCVFLLLKNASGTVVVGMVRASVPVCMVLSDSTIPVYLHNLRFSLVPRLP